MPLIYVGGTIFFPSFYYMPSLPSTILSYAYHIYLYHSIFTCVSFAFSKSKFDKIVSPCVFIVSACRLRSRPFWRLDLICMGGRGIAFGTTTGGGTTTGIRGGGTTTGRGGLAGLGGVGDLGGDGGRISWCSRSGCASLSWMYHLIFSCSHLVFSVFSTS